MSNAGDAGTYHIENQHPVAGQNIGDHNTNTQTYIGTQNHFYGSDGKSVSPLPAERVWNVPFPHNPFFTGREEMLAQLHANFHAGHATALSQPQAMSGLGGIGKTQIAVEYAHRYRQSYTAVLWVRAESLETLISSYNDIAALLNLPEREVQDQDILIQAVKRWLHTHQGWLLLVDNADEPEYLLPFLPTVIGGHLIITTRASDVSHLGLGVAHSLVVETFSPEQGTRFLLKRAGLLALDAELTLAPLQDRIVAQQISQELGGLPLALDQAGAYLKATGRTLATYQHLYQQHRLRLLKERRGREHPEPVATTWSLSFQRVEEKSRAAADLLRLCAYLSPDAIPEAILTKGIASMVSIDDDPSVFDQAIEILHAYSLLTWTPQTQSISVHRLVQAVVQESTMTETKKHWKQQAVLAVDATRPNMQDVAQWNACEQWLPHALVCATWIEQEQFQSHKSASFLGAVGCYLLVRARYREAEPLLKRALAISEHVLGATHSDTAQSLNNLASLYRNQGQYTDAEPLLKRALAIYEQVLGATHPDTATSLNNLAALYRSQGQYTDAEPLLKRALAIREHVLGATHSDTAQSLNNLAELYRNQGQYTDAEPLLKRALAIREQVLGATHPDTATSLNNLAELYRNQSKYLGAEPLYQRALAIYEQVLGATHPNTATSLSNLASFYRNQGQYTDAEPLLKRALAISEQVLGATHPNTATSLNNIALLYSSQSKYLDAEPLLKRALAIYEQVLGATHPDTATSLNNLAALYRSQGQYTDAEPLLKRALAIREQVLGATHPDTATSLNNLAELYRNQGQYTDAEPLLKRALAISEQVLGATHPNTQTIQENYSVLIETQRFPLNDPI